MHLFAVKFYEVTSNPGICVYENVFTDSWGDVISVKFNSKKVHEDDIFVRQDILQLIFFVGRSWSSSLDSESKR